VILFVHAVNNTRPNGHGMPVTNSQGAVVVDVVDVMAIMGWRVLVFHGLSVGAAGFAFFIGQAPACIC